MVSYWFGRGYEVIAHGRDLEMLDWQHCECDFFVAFSQKKKVLVLGWVETGGRKLSAEW